MRSGSHGGSSLSRTDSDEAEVQDDDTAIGLKERGNHAFKQGAFASAVQLYSAGLDAAEGVVAADGTANGDVGSDSVHLLLSNRAAAQLALAATTDHLQGEDAEVRRLVTAALTDAERCTSLAPSFRRGWMRLAAACAHPLQRDYRAAIAAASEAACLDKAGAAADAVEAIAAALVARALDVCKEAGADSESNATEGLDVHVAADAHIDEMSCAQCLAMVFEPVTLADGQAVCKPCVSKYRRTRIGSPNVACRLYGSHTNVLLKQIASQCLPRAVETARRRHAGNEHFRQRRYLEAIQEYTNALGAPIGDEGGDMGGYVAADTHVLLANRSAANLAAHQSSAAEKPATMASTAQSSGASYLAAAALDADAAVLARADWSRGYYRRAVVAMSQSDQSIQPPPAAAADLALSLALELAAQGNCRAGGVLVRAKERGVSWDKFLECVRAAFKVRAQDTAQDYSRAGMVTIPAATKQTGASFPLAALALVEAGAVVAAQTRRTAVAAARLLPHDAVLALREELNCCLCCCLLCQPTALPCGHTLCRHCVERTLDHAFDHAPRCPLCRADLTPLLTWLNVSARSRCVTHHGIGVHDD
eukprot:SAG11_NODE_1745_length_4334_cov_2.520425_1_plen_592_part_00